MDEDIKIWKKKFYLQQKRVFLIRCQKSLIILPSNQYRNIDLDLILIQQSRRITNSLQKIDEEISSCPLKWYSLSQKSKNFLKNFVSQYKQYFIKKFNWLYNKQFTQINKLKCANKTSIKIKKMPIATRLEKEESKKKKKNQKLNP